MKTTREQFTEMLDALFEAWEDRVAPGDAGKRPYSEQRAVIMQSDERALEAVLEFIVPILGDIARGQSGGVRMPPHSAPDRDRWRGGL